MEFLPDSEHGCGSRIRSIDDQEAPSEEPSGRKPSTATTDDYTTCMERGKRVANISIRIEADVKEVLERMVAADERTLSSFIGRVLRRYVDETKQAGRCTKSKG